MMWTGIRDWPNYMWQMSGLPLTMTERQMDVHSSCEMPSCIGQVSCKEKEAGADLFGARLLKKSLTKAGYSCRLIKGYKCRLL